MAVISEVRAWKLLVDHAARNKPDWKDSMLVHAEIVLDLSTFIAGLMEEKVDMETLRLGAILHDIGRTRAERTVEHGVLSADTVREEGFPEAVARICETHVGVGISREEAKGLGLGERDLVPRTLEEKIVNYADNLLFYIPEEGIHEIRDGRAVVQRFREELGEGYAVRTARFIDSVEALFSVRMVELEDFIKNYNETLRSAGK